MTPWGLRLCPISDCYVTYFLCYSIVGHSLGALMHHIIPNNMPGAETQLGARLLCALKC